MKSNEKSKSLKLEYRFKDINTKKYSYTEPSKIIKIGDEIKFEFNLVFMPNNKNNTIELILNLNITNLNINICEFQSSVIFYVKNLDKLPTKDNKIKIPDTLMTQLISLSISTIRGILVEKGKGTIIEKLILPPLDPKKFIPKDDDYANRE